MSGLLELAERCEKATGPHRELDYAISEGIGKGCVRSSKPLREDHAEETGGFTIPRYTASLDAAMTLVPEGWRPVIDMASEEGAAIVDVWAAPAASPQPTRRHAKAATPALALCGAALRALTHQTAEERDNGH
jgi:hypothetical protein